jgi:hypothetical protein
MLKKILFVFVVAVPPFQSHLVEPPITPATPNIVFASPSIITGCSWWAVDLTATSGDGGRGFKERFSFQDPMRMELLSMWVYLTLILSRITP